MLKKEDLNDFIAPGTLCIKEAKTEEALAQDTGTSLAYEVGEDKILPSEKAQAPKAVKISLNDCLACSGCITSSETLFIEGQSVNSLREVLLLGKQKEGVEGKQVVISIAPQVLVSFMTQYDILSLEATFFRLRHFLLEKGAFAVIDLYLMNEVCLSLAYEEFSTRMAAYFKTEELRKEEETAESEGEANSQNLLWMSNHCPGWLSFAEKRLPAYRLSQISGIKTSHQILGFFLKQQPFEADFLNALHIQGASLMDAEEKVSIDVNSKVKEASLFHVSIMMCYDKKLEAARDTEFLSVDLVLTAAELDSWLRESHPTWFHSDSGASPFDAPSLLNSLSPLESAFSGLVEGQFRCTGDSIGNSGYFEYILHRFAKDQSATILFNNEPIQGTPPSLSNATDISIYTLEKNGIPFGTFQRLAGFKNLQNLQRKQTRSIKKKAAEKHVPILLLDLLACPSGCLNGPGLLHRPKAGQSSSHSQIIQRLRKNYGISIQSEESYYTNSAVQSRIDVFKKILTPHQIHLPPYKKIYSTQAAITTLW
jgi:iron only hydrogenase large subunit-like protein